MLLREETIAIQKQLAKYCRDGELTEIKGARKDRLPHYRRLVYNVMYGIIEKAFPITKSILSEGDFKALVDGYLERHDAQIPQVWRVPGEFYEFYNTKAPLLIEDYPYLLDLLKLEWLEILVYNQEDGALDECTQRKPEVMDRVVFNPDFDISEYSYPVFKGQWEEILSKKGKHYMLIFRHQESKKAHFLEISALHVTLIGALKSQKVSEAISLVIERFELSQLSGIQDILMSFIEKLYDQGLILGVQPTQ